MKRTFPVSYSRSSERRAEALSFRMPSMQGSVSFTIRGNLERYASRWGTYLVFLKPIKK